MSSALYDSVARIARHEADGRPAAAVGRVTEVFTAPGAVADHAVTVELRDSGLLLPRVPVAVGVMGFAAIPAVDDLVVVVFANGSHEAPVVVGRLYNADEEPPDHADGEIVLRLPSRDSTKKLALAVSGDEPALRLDLSDTVHVELLGDSLSLKVGDTLELRIEQGGGGRVSVAAGQSQITLKQDGDVTVSAAGKLTLEGTQVEVAGSASVKLSGAQVEIN